MAGNSENHARFDEVGGIGQAQVQKGFFTGRSFDAFEELVEHTELEN